MARKRISLPANPLAGGMLGGMGSRPRVKSTGGQTKRVKVVRADAPVQASAEATPVEPYTKRNKLVRVNDVEASRSAIPPKAEQRNTRRVERQTKVTVEAPAAPAEDKPLPKPVSAAPKPLPLERAAQPVRSGDTDLPVRPVRATRPLPTAEGASRAFGLRPASDGGAVPVRPTRPQRTTIAKSKAKRPKLDWT